MQHAPKREVLGDFPMMPMPTVASEIALIEAFADTRVIGVTINHEEMTAAELDRVHRRPPPRSSASRSPTR